MSQEISARLLPQKPSKWAKILLNRKVPIFLFFLLELAFLVLGTLIECFYLFIFAQSFHGLPFQTFLVDHHCPLSHFWDRLALFFAS